MFAITLAVCGDSFVGDALAGDTERVTLDAAIRAAQSAGLSVIEVAADSLAARGALAAARGHENPSLAVEYTKSPPRYHASLDLPLPFAWDYGSRVRAAEATLTGATARLQFERAAARFAAEAAYAAALAAAAHAEISQREADDAATLLSIAQTRRDAGDASDLDVRLARIHHGRALNALGEDSLQSVQALIDLQRVMGRESDRAAIALADTLAEPPLLPAESETTEMTWSVAAAEAASEAAAAQLRAERRAVFSSPSLLLGVEGHDPSGGETGALPTVGLSLPLPIFNRHGGEITQAAAERDRRAAELAQARRESAASLAQARRACDAARVRLHRDRALLDDAARIIEMSRLAYAEGEVPLVTVLETLRSSRDIEAATIDDLAAVVLAEAAFRMAAAYTEVK